MSFRKFDQAKIRLMKKASIGYVFQSKLKKLQQKELKHQIQYSETDENEKNHKKIIQKKEDDDSYSEDKKEGKGISTDLESLKNFNSNRSLNQTENSESYSENQEEKEEDNHQRSEVILIPLRNHDGIISSMINSRYKVIVKASSFWSDSTLPENIINYNQAHWNSLNEPNSWIAITFQVKVHVDSYLLRSWIYGGSFILNWKFEGLADDEKWKQIDQRTTQNTLNGALKETEFICACSEAFRTFRFVQIGASSSSNEKVYHCFHLNFIELSGVIFSS
jgi:hypothetical protein